MIRKFILWESGRAAELSGLPDAVASHVRQLADSQTTEAIDVDTFPLRTQLALRRHLSLSQKGGEIALSSELGVPSLSLATTITLEDLQLSVRSTNCLRAASIRNLDDLLLWTAPELKDLQFFGAKCLREITEILAQIGCSLADSVQPRGSSASEGIFEASVAPLPLVLRFDEFISDPTTLDALHQAGWRFVNDFSMLSLEEVSSRARLNQERSESLHTSLQEFCVNIPSRVPEWLNENLATVRSAFQKEITAYIASLEIGSESSLTVSPAVSLHDELGRIIPAKYSADKRYLISLLFGFDGGDPMTLDAVARAISPPLTRERVRQIALPITSALSERNSGFPWLVRAVRRLEQLAPCTCAYAENLLMEEGISGTRITVASILSLAKRAHIESELKIEGDYLRTALSSNLLAEIARRAAKLSSRWGVADWQELSKEFAAEQSLKAPEGLPEVIYLDEQRRYFVFPNRENSLANRLARILAVAPSLPLAAAYRGLFRDTRSDIDRLPEALFPEFCRVWNWCRVDGDSLHALPSLPAPEASGDDLLVLLLKEAGRPLTRRAIQALAAQHGLSETTITHALSYSNVIASHGGFFSVVGDPQLSEPQSESLEELPPIRTTDLNVGDEPEDEFGSILPIRTDPKSFVEGVVLAVRRQTGELKLSPQWSIAELRLSRSDQERLLAWGRNAAWDFRSDTGSYRLPSGELVRKRAGLGLTFLLFAAEIDRRFAGSGSIWPEIENALGQDQRSAFMFRAGVPKLALRDGIEDACRKFGIRHGFEDSGQQVIWRTVGLQYGLRRSYLPYLHRMLSEPVALQPIAMQLLLEPDRPNSSSEFQAAWGLLKAIRAGALSGDNALQRLKEHSWLRSFSPMDLYSACRTASSKHSPVAYVEAEQRQDAYSYFGLPKLVWDSQEVSLDFPLTTHAPAWVDVSSLTLLCEEPFRKERIHVLDGTWSLSNSPIRIPLTRRESLGFRFAMFRGKELVLEERTDVRLDSENPFVLFGSSGQMMTRPDVSKTTDAIYLITLNNVQVSGIPNDSPFRTLLCGKARLTLIPKFSVPALRILDVAGEIIWAASSELSSVTPKSKPRIDVAGARWGQGTTITIPPLGFVPGYLTLNTGETLPILNDHGHMTVQASPDLARAQTARVFSASGENARPIAVDLVHRGLEFGAAIEKSGKWISLSGAETLDGAMLSTSRLLAKVRGLSLHQELCWSEGSRALSGLKVYGGSLLNVFGIGEPLKISSGVYNRPEIFLDVAKTLTDGGFFRTVRQENPGEWVATLPFDSDLEAKHSLWMWSEDCARPTELPQSSISQDRFTVRWKAPKNSIVFGWAFSFAGQRIGSICLEDRLLDFSAHLRTHWRDIVGWIRWWHVPILQESLRRTAEISAHRFPVDTLAAWNLPFASEENLIFDELQEDAWATASRELLWDWRPTSDEALVVARAFHLWTGDIEEDAAQRSDIAGVGLLARVNPLLLARVVSSGLPALYQFPPKELAALIGLILHAVNENALHESFRIRDLCESYAQGESRIDGEFISRSIVKVARADFRGESVSRKNLQAAFHQPGLREIVTISLLRDILFEWRDGVSHI